MDGARVSIHDPIDHKMERHPVKNEKGMETPGIKVVRVRQMLPLLYPF